MKIKISILLPVFTLLAFTQVISPVVAQSSSSVGSTDLSQSALSVQDQPPVIQDVEGLRASFIQHTQDPDTKTVRFEMILKSDIDSDRVEINWYLNGVSYFNDKSQQTKRISISKGKTYSIPIDITVEGYAVTEVRATAEAFKADNTYLVTIRKDFASNSDFEVMPITSDYTTAKNLSLLKKFAILIVVIAVLSVGIFFGVKAFTKWINKNDVT